RSLGLGGLLGHGLGLLTGPLGLLLDHRLLRRDLGLFVRLVVFRHLPSLQACLALVAHGQDASDLALGRPQPRAVLERAGRGLEAQVEELLARVVQAPLELLVAQVTKLLRIHGMGEPMVPPLAPPFSAPGSRPWPGRSGSAPPAAKKYHHSKRWSPRLTGFCFA